MFYVFFSEWIAQVSDDKNQMQDAMTIWDSICHSQWFEKTAIVGAQAHGIYLLLMAVPQILFLNKNDLFEKKVQVSSIRNYFPVRHSYRA